MAEPLHPIPPCELVFNDHEQCPLDWHVRDPELARVTEGSLLGAIVRLVGGFDPKTQRWSRTRISCQINGWLELGWAHLSTIDNVARFLTAIATRLPEVATWAWGDKGRELAQLGASTAFVTTFRGRKDLPDGAEWFTAGWYQIAVRGDVQQVYLSEWWSHVAGPMSWMQGRGYKLKGLLGAAARARNSGPDYDELKRLVDAEGEALGLQRFLAWWDANGKSDRAEAIRTWPEFQGEITSWPTVNDLDWGTALVWPETSGAVAVSSGAPGVAGASVWGRVPKWARWAGVATVGAAALAGGAWLLLGGKKRKRKRKRR